MRGATHSNRDFKSMPRISIHAPHAGRDDPHTFRLAVISRTFQSTRPMRGATEWDTDGLWKPNISIHAPHAGRDPVLVTETVRDDISIHAPHAGRDFLTPLWRRAKRKFQSTRPMRGATRAREPKEQDGRDFNPRAPCGARPARTPPQTPIISISIHAPHAGRDNEECERIVATVEFQSTRPMRGATRIRSCTSTSCGDFNPRAPCGARRRGSPASKTGT